MDAAHILLVHPWFYDLNVLHHGRENTHAFRYQNKSITLNPCRPNELLPSPTPKPSPTSSSPIDVSTSPRGTISFLHHRTFERLRNSNKFYLTIIARELPSNYISFPSSPSCVSTTGILYEIDELLEEFYRYCSWWALGWVTSP